MYLYIIHETLYNIYCVCVLIIKMGEEDTFYNLMYKNRYLIKTLL